MDIQDVLTIAAEAFTFGYAALLMLFLVNRIAGDLFSIFHSPATTPRTANPAPAKPSLEKDIQRFDEKDAVSNYTPNEKGIDIDSTLGREQQTLTVAEEPWLVAVEATEEPCCCHTVIATPTKPLLLLLSAIGGADPPDLAGLSSTELRNICQSAGIKWRNTNGSRHLSKPEMLHKLATR